MELNKYWAICIDHTVSVYFSHSCDQISDKTQIKKAKDYPGSRCKALQAILMANV